MTNAGRVVDVMLYKMREFPRFPNPSVRPVLVFLVDRHHRATLLILRVTSSPALENSEKEHNTTTQLQAMCTQFVKKMSSYSSLLVLGLFNGTQEMNWNLGCLDRLLMELKLFFSTFACALTSCHVIFLLYPDEGSWRSKTSRTGSLSDI